MQKLLHKLWKLKYWLAAVLIVIIGFGGYISRPSKKPDSTQGLEFAVVEIGEITEERAATGTIKPVNMVDITSKATGLVKEVRVQENEVVKAGQVLMLIEDTSIKLQAVQRKADLDNKLIILQRSRQLHTAGAISKDKLDQAQTDYEVSLATYEDVQSKIEDTIIRSPIDGTIIGKPTPVGQYVTTGFSSQLFVATVADLSKMQIETLVDETDIGKIKVGNLVNFAVDAYQGKAFTGRVSNISQKGTVMQNVIYYTVLVEVNSTENLLRQNMTARVKIITEKHQNALLLPFTALRINKGQQYVKVLRNGNIENIDVKIGINGDEKAEVLSGLQQGEQVVLEKRKTQTP